MSTSYLFIFSAMLITQLVKPLLKKEVLERFKVSGYSMHKYTMQVLLFLLLLLIFVCLLIGVLIIVLLYNQIDLMYLYGYLLNSLLFASVALTMVMFIYVVTNNAEFTLIFSIMLSTFLSLSAGVFDIVPIPLLQGIVKLSPIYYFVQLNNDGFNLMYVIIQMCFMVVFILGSINILKYRRRTQ